MENARERLGKGGVKHGQRCPHHIALDEPQTLHPTDHAGMLEHRMGERTAFRHGGGARRVDHHRDVVGAYPCAALANARLGTRRAELVERASVQEAGRARCRKRDRRAQFRRRFQLQNTDGFMLGQARQRAPEQLHVVGVLLDDVVGHDHLDAGIGGDVGDFAGFEARVVEHGHGADERRAEQDVHEVEAVGHQDADPVAGLHPQRHERAAGAVCPGDELRVGGALVHEDHGVAVRVRGRGGHQFLAQRFDFLVGHWPAELSSVRKGESDISSVSAQGVVGC